MALLYGIRAHAKNARARMLFIKRIETIEIIEKIYRLFLKKHLTNRFLCIII